MDPASMSLAFQDGFLLGVDDVLDQDLHLFPSGKVPHAALVRITEPSSVDLIPNGEAIPIQSFDN